MEDSKLISLLKTFSRSDWRRFKDFLASPFFNKNKEALIFYEYLKHIAPNFEEEKLSKAIIFKKVYPKKAFNGRVLEDAIYYLLKQAENYLRLIRLEKEEQTGNLLILEELMDRSLDKHYRIYKKKSKKLLANIKHKDSNFYLFQYRLSDIAKRYFLAQNQRKHDPIIQESLDNLDQFYFFHKLKASCQAIEWKNIIAADFKLIFTEPVIQHLLETKKTITPTIKIYLTAYHLFTIENAGNYFNDLRNLLKQYDKELSYIEKGSLYMFGVNYCGLQIQQNNKVIYYVEQCLELYLEGVEQKFIYVNGFLSPWTFKNIVKLGFNLKRFDWTANFIQMYYTHLEQSYQEDAFHYSLADLNYRKQNYKEAQTHLIQVQYSDIFYSLGAKTMLIKLYYEIGEEEALLSLIASFTIYLKRNKKIASNIINAFLNFTALTYQIVRAKRFKIPTIIEKIKTIEPLTNRRWLLSISEELIENKN